MPRILPVTLLALGLGLDPEAHAAPDAPLKALRETAAALLAAKPGSTAAPAFCELATARPTDPCAGPERLEDRLTIRENGTVGLIRFRSFSEGEEPAPGEYQGRFAADKWRGLLETISKMDWVKAPPGMPMPGPSETHARLSVGSASGRADYSLAGAMPVGQDRIAAGFDEASLFTALATDTLWALRLDVKNAHFKNGILELQALRQVSGKSKADISFPRQSDSAGCGTVSLRWFEDQPEKPGVTPLPVEIHETKASPSQEGSDFRFALPPKGKYPRKARLVQTGVRVRTSEKTVPVTVTVFSPFFSF